MRSARAFLLLQFAYVAVLAPFAADWIRAASRAVPSAYSSFPADERLIVWALAWVAHALRTAPLHVFDANIFYPAPRQLAGSEHFATSQVIFAPLYWITGNPVLSATVTAMLSYPLAAVAMNRLLDALGCGTAAAWAGGIVLALGPLTVPGNLHVLQYAGFYPPLVALALTRLRERPGPDRAALFGVALIAAFFSSYYMAVLAMVLVGVWGAAELVRPGPGRGAFVRSTLVVVLLASALLAAASLPYLTRAPHGRPDLGADRVRHVLIAKAYLTGTMPLFALALPGVLVAALRGAAASVARRGCVVALVAAAMVLGPSWQVADLTIPLPFAVLSTSLGGFFRYPFRFVVLLGLALALLSAAAVQALDGWRRWAGVAAASVVTAVVLCTRASGLVGRLDEIGGPRLDVYDAVAQAVKGAPGPLLELPVIEPLADPGIRGTQPDAMVGSTRHWLPLVGGFTGYEPPHWPFVKQALGRLPQTEALDDLVDMTHLRWMLLLPGPRWAQPAVADAIAALPGVVPVLSRDGYRLLLVSRDVHHPRWFEAIAHGVAVGSTVLGTPLARIPESDAQATVTLVRPARWTAPAGRALPVQVRVTNAGAAPWPVTAAPDTDDGYVVRLTVRSWRAGEPVSEESGERPVDFDLPRDVDAGEEVTQVLWIPPHPEPGSYVIEIGVQQKDGARFDGPGNRRLRMDLQVVER